MEKIKKRTYIIVFAMFFFSVLFGSLLGLALAQTVNTKNTENFTEFTLALPTKLLDINGEFITEFASDEKRETISLTQLPQHMIDALITREDRIFYEHKGYSLKAILRAITGVITGRSLGGGSTLTQQIAGTLYCDRTEKSVIRKLRELWWAIQMERRYSKDEILELYLNKVFLGAGTYGVNAASKYYFGHDATQITPAEAAILVVQLSNPSHYNPFNYPNRAMARQKNVLDEMVNSGYLSRHEADSSFEDFWANFDYTRINTAAYYMRDDKAPWFSEYVRRELSEMHYGSGDIYTSGYTVHTTLNLKNQQAAQKTMDKHIREANISYRESKSKSKTAAASTYIPMTELMSLLFNLPQLKTSSQQIETKAISAFNNEINPLLDIMSMVFGIEDLKVGIINKANSQKSQESSKTTIEGTLISLENNTGYITALVGGSEFGQSNQLIRAVQAKIQPGSSFKPLYYSAAIDSGKFTPASILSDTPTVFYTADGKPYIPQNFQGTWSGNVQLWYALSQSMNVVSVKILDSIGFDAAIDRAVALLGIPENEIEERGLARVYPLGLGVCSVRPIEMARAFAIFANQGKEVEPIAIRTVEDRNGNIVINPERELRLKQQQKGEAIQVISPQTAYIMTDILQKTVTTGTLRRGAGWGTRFKYKDKDGKSYTLPAAGKTGTTQNWADAWTCGFTPYYAAAFWFGFDKPGQSLGLNITGSTLAGYAWGDYFREIHRGMLGKEFQKPLTGVFEATVCSVSGQILTEGCGDHKTTQTFLQGTQPTEICSVHSAQNNTFLSISRLEKEMYKSGVRTNLNFDSTPLSLDLDFLNATSLEDFEQKLDTSEFMNDDLGDEFIDEEENSIDNSNKVYDYNYLME